MYGRYTGLDTRGAVRFVKEKWPEATHVVIPFSGGHDEGGEDGMFVVKHVGEDEHRRPKFEKLGDLERHFIWEGKIAAYEPDPESSHMKRFERDATDEEVREDRTADALYAPIGNQYGSFAGEFSVSGKVVWDLATGEHIMSGTTYIEEGTSFGDDEIEGFDVDDFPAHFSE